MKTNIATDNLQSQRLLRCGASADTADMFYQTPITVSQKATREDMLLVRKADETSFDTDIPAWSLSALLRLLPKEIYEESTGNSFFFSLAKEFPLSEEYGAAYIPCWDKGDAIVRKRDNNPIEACVQLIEWLKENGHKLTDCPCREKGGVE